MLNSEGEKSVDENDLSMLVASSLRNVIENSVTDPALPYRMLSLVQLSSWKTFQNDLVCNLKRILIPHNDSRQDALLLRHVQHHRTHIHEKPNEDLSFESLMNSNVNFVGTKSDFDRLRQLM